MTVKRVVLGSVAAMLAMSLPMRLTGGSRVHSTAVLSRAAGCLARPEAIPHDPGYLTERESHHPQREYGQLSWMQLDLPERESRRLLHPARQGGLVALRLQSGP
jgi:hypothetical protein